MFVVLNLKQTILVKLGICIAAAYVGMQLPLMLLKSKIQKRQLSIQRAFPDSLDLLLICVESGMSIEAAFKKVSEEIGTQSVALAEELTLTMAELSYLPDRRQAYENLAKRTDLEGVKSVCMALQQAERYGTPLATMLRTMAQENRDMRMSEAEKKAAGLPPKLTVPMILFFLPVLFVVILGPAAIKVMGIMALTRASAAGTLAPQDWRQTSGIPFGSRRRAAVRCAAVVALRPLASGAPASDAGKRHWLRPGRRGRSARAIFSASAKRPSRPTISARFWRTLGWALGWATALRSVASARFSCFSSA